MCAFGLMKWRAHLSVEFVVVGFGFEGAGYFGYTNLLGTVG